MSSDLWRHALAAMVGGGVASLLRFSVGAWVVHLYPNEKIPWATLAVNWLGCLVVGLIYGWASDRWWMGLHMRHLLVTGFLGGFTTFSAFGVETILLFRRGESLLAWSYILASVAGGLILAWTGERIASALSP
ncbi:MAG: fluoride efflux transporter CrcB [Verrucomicrobia bacterium]|nr:fluoride efflux transporter CrcB [Verrucomicrobiota bacterium]